MHLRFSLLLLAYAVVPLLAEERPSESALLSGALRKSGLPEATESVTIPLNHTMAGFAAEVHIDGKPVRLILDTGAAVTILSEETANKLGLNAKEYNFRKSVDITGGQVVSKRALTRRISLGKAWTVHEPVFVAKMAQYLGDGLLGISTLADWDVRIDPTPKTLTLFPAGKAQPLEGETALPLTCELVNPEASISNRQGFRALSLYVPVRVGNHILAAAPDTGYSETLRLSSVRMEMFAPEAMKQALPALVTTTSLSGKYIASRMANLPEFTFGHDTLRGMGAYVVDATPGSTIERTGILGLNLLRHYVMTFRFSAGELRLKPLGTVQEITRASTAGIFMVAGAGGSIIIGDVVPDGPAAKAGLRAGDEMLEIEGHPLKTMKPEQLAAFKRLPPGSNVKVRYRRGEGKPVEATLVLVKR